jgi:dTDP-4-amino-4,6-dideoxygalactose transaminase
MSAAAAAATTTSATIDPARKTEVGDLALFGGAPAFAEKLHVGRPNIGDRDRLLARFNDMLDRRWLTNDGPFVLEFERKICEYVGVRHCVAMCNATIALEIATRALELSGEVIVPSFTFIATAHALSWQEITPVFCDIDPRTHNLDPNRVEQMITPRTSGIIGVHVWGRACEIDALAEVARRHRLKLLFDAAHAFGCSYKGRLLGAFGECEVYSFHATKFLNSFEGGAVVTNNDELAKKLRLMKNFGFAGYDNVIYPGTNGKMCETSGLMGLTSLESLDHFIATNQRNYKQYQAELAGVPGVTLLSYDGREKNNYQYVVTEIDEGEAGISRDLIVEMLWAENVLARRYFYPGLHRMEAYRPFYPHAGLLLPETERVSQRVMVLPTGTAVETGQIRGICSLIKFAVGNGAEIRRRAASRR